MQINKTVLNTMLANALGFAAIGAQAAALNNGDQLTLNAGVAVYTSSGSQIGFIGGSYFAVDGDGNSGINDLEKVAISMGTTGLIIGQATAPGAGHSGLVTSGDANAIEAPWSYFGNTGSHYTTVGVTGSTTSGLSMSGWAVTWASISMIDLSGGAWLAATGVGHTGTTGTFTSGIANFYWNGIYGDAYSLDYRAMVPINDPSGFGGLRYELHLEGVVNSAVPVPAAAWLFGSGLLGLIGIARRKVRN